MANRVAKYGKYAVKRYPAVAKRAKVYVPAVRQLASDVMYLKGLINSEPHYHEVIISNNFDYNGVVIALNSIPQGDQVINREGNRVLPRFMNLKGFVSTTPVTTRVDPINVRVILFRYWGESTSGAGATNVTPSEILENIGSQFAPLSSLNPDNVGGKGSRERRIEVHRSWDLLLGVNNGLQGGYMLDCNVVVNDGGKKVKDHIQFYSAATAQPISGGFYILFISDDVVATEVHYKINSKLTFYDN